MITKVYSTLPDFRQIELSNGFNVVLANRTEDSRDTESTNGLGKTTLLRIIQFCLGSDSSRDLTLNSPALSSEKFGICLLWNNIEIEIERSVSDFKFVWISDCFLAGKDINVSDKKPNKTKISVDDYRNALTKHFVEGQSAYTDTPSFREISHYLIRIGKPAFTDPTQAYQRQSGASRRFCTSFLLGLNWKSQKDLSDTIERRNQVNAANRIIQSADAEAVRNIGELEAERVEQEALVISKAKELQSFNVKSDYAELESQLSEVDEKLHTLLNANFSDKKLLAQCQEGEKQTPPPTEKSAQQIFQSAGAIFKEETLRSLSDVTKFYESIHRNRAEFLKSEIKRLKASIQSRNSAVKQLSDLKSEILKTLNASGALDTLISLQLSYTNTVANLEALKAEISERKRFDRQKDSLTHEISNDRSLMKQDMEDRQTSIDEARSLFANYTKFLYGKSGGLGVDVSQDGYKLTFSIDREGSDGVNQMVVFCFDLMIATLRSRRKDGFLTLIHDSSLFADVDPRQYGLALQLAAATSEKEGFQYICCLNSGALPHEFLSGLDIQSHTRLTLTDDSDKGSLLGMRLPRREL